MRKLFFVSTLIAAFAFNLAFAQAQTVTITVDIDGVITIKTLASTDRLAMENDLLNIADWIVKAVEGKVSKTRERMIRQAIKNLRAGGVAVPASDNALINAYVARPGYKNRAQRDAAAGQ